MPGLVAEEAWVFWNGHQREAFVIPGGYVWGKPRPSPAGEKMRRGDIGESANAFPA